MTLPRQATRRPVVVGFAASNRGIGRAAAILNVAWTLASAGRQVLVVDWTGDELVTQNSLRPFEIGSRGFDDARPDVGDVADVDVNTSELMLTRYAVPPGAGQIEIVRIAPEPPDAPSDRAEAAGEAWHHVLRSTTRHDYVLIETPLEHRSPSSARAIALGCDVVAVLFTLGVATIRQARGLVDGLVSSITGGPTIVPVAVQVDHGDDARRRANLDQVRDMFRDVIDADLADDLPVELPYYPDDPQNQTLAALADDPDDPTNVLAGYVRLTGAVTGRAVTSLPRIPAATRNRYLRRQHQAPEGEPSRIVVVHAPVDRAWAEWVEARLGQVGVRVDRRPADTPLPDGDLGDGVVVIDSPALVGSPAEARLARPAAGEPLDVVHLSVASADEAIGIEPAAVSGGRAVLDVDAEEQSEADVSNRLLAHFGLFGRLGGAVGEPIRWPGRPPDPDRLHLPTRNPAFVGRHRELEELRDLLRTGGLRLTVAGDAGDGKSEIVKEYAHRFAHDYDLVWWVPGHGELAARASLTRLADELVGTETGDSVGALLAGLTDGSKGGRWLLIYDNVDDAATIGRLMPGTGFGQVVVTARTVPADNADDAAAVLRVTPFDPAESRQLLTTRVPGLTVEDADRAARAAGHAPLNVWLASAWLAERTGVLRRHGDPQDVAAHSAATLFLAELDQVEPAELAGLPPHLIATARVLAATVTALRDSVPGRIAIRLAVMCAYLSPGGVSLRLLRSRSLLDRLSAGTEAVVDFLDGNAMALDVVLGVGERHGLCTVEWGDRPQLRMHRVLQELLRTRVISEEDRKLWHGRVLAALAGYAPTESEIDFPETVEKIGELQRHLVVSAALESDNPAVRRWIVNHTRFVYRHGDAFTWQYALPVAERFLARWQAGFGEEDRLLLRLRAQVANLHRALGDYPEALRADRAALRTQRRTLGLLHPETLTTARGVAGDLWYLGRFDDALPEAGEAYLGFRGLHGDDHPDTMMAANNLAVVTYLSGDTEAALRLQQQQHARCVRLFGPRHVDSLAAAAMLGIYLRESGRLGRAGKLTQDAYDLLRAAEQRPTSATSMWMAWMLAVARRRRKLNRGPLLARTAQAYRELFGDTHLNTLGCGLSLAGDYHDRQRSADAVTLARGCLARYEERYETHPYTDACRLNLALYLRGVGDMKESLQLGEHALRNLRESLGDEHPWTLLASANLATLLAGTRDVDQAVHLARTTLDACRELLRGRHPYTELAAANLDLMQHKLGSVAAVPWRERDIDVMPNS